MHEIDALARRPGLGALQGSGHQVHLTDLYAFSPALTKQELNYQAAGANITGVNRASMCNFT